MSKVNDLIDEGDWGGLLGVAINAWQKGAEGVYCTCETPDVVGYDLMCGTCCLEVESQRAKREEAMRSPHPYRPMADRDFGMCDFCSRWKDDPLHTEEAHR